MNMRLIIIIGLVLALISSAQALTLSDGSNAFLISENSPNYETLNALKLGSIIEIDGQKYEIVEKQGLFDSALSITCSGNPGKKFEKEQYPEIDWCSMQVSEWETIFKQLDDNIETYERQCNGASDLQAKYYARSQRYNFMRDTAAKCQQSTSGSQFQEITAEYEEVIAEYSKLSENQATKLSEVEAENKDLVEENAKLETELQDIKVIVRELRWYEILWIDLKNIFS